MTYTPTIYDWRDACAPIDQVFRAGGEDGGGGVTLGGVLTSNREPGGRGELSMRFAPFATPEANRDASWTISRITNGAIMRVRLYNTIQLVPDSDIIGAASVGTLAKSHSPAARDNDLVWNPVVDVTAAGAKGSTTVVADLGDIGPVLDVGHVVGFTSGSYNFCHSVMDISYAGASIATITVEPPLRRAITTASKMQLRPSMLVICTNARDVMSNFTSGRHMAMNDAMFVEALV